MAVAFSPPSLLSFLSSSITLYRSIIMSTVQNVSHVHTVYTCSWHYNQYGVLKAHMNRCNYS